MQTSLLQSATDGLNIILGVSGFPGYLLLTPDDFLITGWECLRNNHEILTIQ